MSKNKQRLSASQLEGLPITISEARKLLGATANNLSDDEVAQHILCLHQLAISITKTLPLQENHYNYVSS